MRQQSLRGLQTFTRTVIVVALALTLASCSRVRAPVFFGQGHSVNQAHGGRAQAGNGPYQVTVRRGDTLSEIALRHNVPTRDLARANSIRAPFTIFAGQELTVPGTPTHTVRRGESLSVIAERYNMNTRELARANRIRRPYTIYAGQDLALPWSANSTRPSRSTAVAANTSRTSRPATRPRTARVAPAPRRISPAPASAVTARELSPPPRSGQGFMWPVDGRILSDFGPIADGQRNDGINIGVPTGTPVKAADSGVVIYAGNEIPGFGRLVLLRHDNGYVTAYGHNSRINVRQGYVVDRGEIIALSGNSGRVSEPQLHFEVRRNSRAVNPAQFLAGT